MIITDQNLLRQPCEPVQPDEIPELRKKLEYELKISGEMGRPGIGLAAPQIGINKKMAIVRINDFYSVDLINISGYKGYDLIPFKNEGCLSFPDMYIDTVRYNEIYINDNFTEPHEFIATGLFAVAIQHELDHLNGVLLVDKIKQDK